MFQKFLAAVLVLACARAVLAEISITNHQPNSTVRYPVVLLRGTVDAESKKLFVRVAGTETDSTIVRQGDRFKSLVELKQGRNVVELKTEDDRHSIEINYQPQTNPHYVRLIWMTDSDGDTKFAAPSEDVPQDYAARMRTAAQLMQTFTAERMNDLGLGRRTFRLERDSDGQIIVHTLKAPKKAEYYYGLQDRPWWFETSRWLNQEHDDPFAKNIVLAAFTRKDPETGRMKAHTALGGGNLGLFGSASVFSWPRSIPDAVSVFQDATRVDPTLVHDDSVGRSTHWGLASTTIGATLHEMGHTFGLPHCKDRFGIMTRGFDHFNRFFTFIEPPSGRNRNERIFSQKEEAYFAPISASYLQWSRWFQLDEQESISNERPRIVIDEEAEQVIVTADSGVTWVGFSVGTEIYSHREFKDELPQKVELSFEEIGKLLDGKKLSHVTTISANGLSDRATARQ